MEARKKANTDRDLAEKAIEQATKIKKESKARAEAIIEKAKEAAGKAAKAESEAVRKEQIASIKITA
jgi:hypothetical protein